MAYECRPRCELTWFQIRYTLGGVVASLAMIEERQTAVVETRTIAVDEKEDPDAPLDMDKARLIDEEVMVVNQVPLTSSIRKTVLHLCALGGFWARYRGAGSALIYNLVQPLAVSFISMFVMAFTGFPVLGRVIGNIAANVLCARIHMAWTHAVISEPSSKRWSERMSETKDRKIWRALALPALVHSLAELATYGLPAAMFVYVGPEMEGPKATEHMVIRGVMALISFIMLNVLILLPASVTRTRVEASFLPEDDKTIVPFDRTFNGAVNMLSLDSRSGRKSLFIEAWRSFDMPSRIRLVKFYVKEAAIELSFATMGAIFIGTQLLVLGINKDNVAINVNGM